MKTVFRIYNAHNADRNNYFILIILLLISQLIIVTSCRIYDREYVEPIEIPIVDQDTIHIPDWDENHSGVTES